MNTTVNKTYYELLNVSPDSPEREIEDAYRKTRDLYSGDSVASYSLYSPEEKEDLLGELEAAYSTLTDPERRKAYDEELRKNPVEEPSTTEVDLGSLVGAASNHAASPSPPPSPAGRPARTRPERGPGRRHTEFPGRATLKNPLIVDESMDTRYAEQYRILYTRLEDMAHKSGVECFAVTSSVKGEGKTLTSVNLAYVMAAEFKKRVVVVECDMRDPSLGEYFDLPEDTPGLAGLVRDEVALDKAILKIEGTDLHILPAGGQSSTPQPLSSIKMAALLKNLREEFDFVILDSPPIIPLADINLISRLVDGLVMVVRACRTPKDTVKKALSNMPNANLLGMVLNGTDSSMKEYYY